MADRVVFWDFDGTLAKRDGLWGRCLIEVLDEYEAGHSIGLDTLSPHLRNGFPWHKHEVAHPELSEPELWWAHISNILTSALAESGVERGRVIELSKLARREFLESSRWVVFEDSIEALELVHRNGWQNAILSNHVPELDDLVARLGLDSVMDAVITSARTGFEKPHPQAYRVAMEQLGQPNHAWMIGDNPIADVAGAKRAGLQAILVRNPDFDDESRRFISESWGGSDWLDWENHVDRQAGDALEAASMILASEDTTGSV